MDVLAAITEAHGREITVVDRETVLDRAPKRGLVACSRDLIVRRQAGSVHIDRARHAERMRFRGHQLGEVLFAATDRLSHDDSRIIGGAGDQPLDGVLDCDRRAGFEVKLGGMLTRCELGYRERRVELELASVNLLEQQIKRHDLGQRRRMSRLVDIFPVQNLRGVVVDHDGRIGRMIVGPMQYALVALALALLPGVRRMLCRPRRICLIPTCAHGEQCQQTGYSDTIP